MASCEYIIQYVEAFEHNSWTFEVHFDTFSVFQTVWGILYKHVLYVLQDYNTVRTMIVWIDPKMKNYTIDSEKEYGVNCWDITVDRLWSHFDWFAFGHYFGWGMKVTKSSHFFSLFQKL